MADNFDVNILCLNGKGSTILFHKDVMSHPIEGEHVEMLPYFGFQRKPEMPTGLQPDLADELKRFKDVSSSGLGNRCSIYAGHTHQRELLRIHPI